jgi:nucleotide-binding universal stress UspA family protein
MIERILFPTDGSVLSERALAMAEILARAQGAELIVARVLEPSRLVALDAYDSPMGTFDTSTPEVYTQLEEALTEEARADLDNLAQRLGSDSVHVRTILLKGVAARELLFLEEQEQPGLVVMGSHGRTGLARVALGSVSDRLVSEGQSPVLIVRSFSPDTTWTERALVPLDGSPAAEAALPIVETLAGKPLKSVKLLRAVTSTSELPDAISYIKEIGVRLSRAGLEVKPEVRVDQPAAAIEAEAQSVDFVIMATHGRGGFDRFRHGSVAFQAARNLAAPVLLVRAQPSAQPEANSTTTEPAKA